jgi:hypothetical protein
MGESQGSRQEDVVVAEADVEVAGCPEPLARRGSAGSFAKTSVNSTDRADHPGVIAWPPLIFLGCAGVGSLLQCIFPIRVMRYSVSLSLRVALAVVSASLAIWAECVMKAVLIPNRGAPARHRHASPLGAVRQFGRAFHAQPCSPASVAGRCRNTC